MNYEQLIHECGESIRQGLAGEAVKRLRKLNLSKVPRPWRLPLANLFRRTGLIEGGLRVLTPVVHPSKEAQANPTPAELSEYAVLLQRFGAVAEARKILERVDSDEVPESLLYRAFCHFNHWEYFESVPLLQKFLGAAITPYQNLVGRVNLSDALIFLQDYAGAQDLLRKALSDAEQGKHRRLAGNCLEMQAQIALLNGKVSDARALLNRASEALGTGETLDGLYLQKWRSVLAALETNSVAPLAAFRKEAEKRGHFESVRLADRYAQRIAFDERGFHHLYFGTPSRSFRESLRQQFNRGPSVKTFCYGSGTGRKITVATAELDGKKTELRGGKLHVALNALTRDFYQPISMGALFAELFADEHFNIFSSPTRVHQTLRRVRSFFREAGLDATVENVGRGYAIRSSGVVFEVSLEREIVDHLRLFLLDLRAHFEKAGSFKAAHASAALGISPTSFRRLMTEALATGQIEKFGASASTMYFFRQADIKAAA